MIWLLIGYMWLFVHRPFEIWTVLATFHVERVYMVITIVYWFTSRPALPSGNRLHWYFGAFVLVMLASWFVSPYQEEGEGTVEVYLKYVVFYVLLVTSVRDEQGLQRIIAGYLAVMAIWMIHSVREYYCGNRVWAQYLDRLVPVGHTYDFNDFAGLIVCSLPFPWVLWRYWRTRWRRVLLLVYLGLSCYCVILTCSRMGFVGMVLASILFCLASPKRWRLLAAYPAIFAATWMLLPQGQRERYLTLTGVDYRSDSGRISKVSAGDFRYAGFEAAIPLFEEHPLLGVGPMGFRTIKGMMPHNLYGQVLAELGVAGAITFGLILLGIAQNVLEARRIVQGTAVVDRLLPWDTVNAAAAAILLLAIMSWGFNFLYWYVWLWFGGFQVVALSCLGERTLLAQSNDSVELVL